tara:strand:- start:3827 stop:4495 length:669 start_codon:yes stop_codon:yes gene_type:complete
MTNAKDEVTCKEDEVCRNRDLVCREKGPLLEKFLIKQAGIFLILLFLYGVGMAFIRISKYDLTKQEFFHKLAIDKIIAPQGLSDLFKYYFSETNISIGLAINKMRWLNNKWVAGGMGFWGLFVFALIPIGQLFLILKQTNKNLTPGWFLWKFPWSFLFMIGVTVASWLSLITYLFTTPEFLLTTIIFITSVLLYLYMPQYPYMPAGLSGGGLISLIFLLGGK